MSHKPGQSFPFPSRTAMYWETCHITYDQAVEMFNAQTATQRALGHNPIVSTTKIKRVQYSSIQEAQAEYSKSTIEKSLAFEKKILEIKQTGNQSVSNLVDRINNAESATFDGILGSEATISKQVGDDAEAKAVSCKHEDQAFDVAIYMVKEIQNNAVLEVTKKMQRENAYSAVKEIEQWNQEASQKSFFQQAVYRAAMPDFVSLELASRTAALAQWTSLVAQDRAWDHKPKIAAGFPTAGQSTRFHHKYKDYEYFYDIWSNIHYGYMGILCGFSESILLDGAGLEQIGTDILSSTKEVTDRSASNGEGLRAYDDTTDNLSIRIGIELYRDYPNAEDINADILMQYIERADYPIMKGSKLLHQCS
ncbi:polymorphic toxin type 44 domain-containing protein [Vibrio caribbeanicus]|uniref:polymorphic toxin type 44 domain-containing protein n=1 Tax=Vibrio caribbeanicus TaxID=701175 RepID=UPI0022841AE2|nr:polymorphic toxin type 44 domain-containing protein [Vibrio caribbeanicus]MCY9845748.1 polymorphic toxin type 44 domain-containing protein [Vibrio caribbeanicus]